MTKVCILDDEVLICETLSKYLNELGYEVPAYALFYDEALKMIKDEKPDIMLLDVNIGGKQSGIDVAKYIRTHHNIPLIFISSYSDRATLQEAALVKPNGYLVKPFNKNDLFAAIEIALSNFSENKVNENKELDFNEIKLLTDALFVKEGFAYKKIFFKEIIFIKSEGVYLEIYTKEKKFLVRESLKNITEILPKNTFYQTHRSYIVNLNAITLIEKEYLQIGTVNVPISRSNQNDFFNRLNLLQ
ncbi:MAG: response regulator [Chitinophagales bacterium]|nr:response regulator [Chitinophagales bacterium]